MRVFPLALVSNTLRIVEEARIKGVGWYYCCSCLCVRASCSFCDVDQEEISVYFVVYVAEILGEQQPTHKMSISLDFKSP